VEHAGVDDQSVRIRDDLFGLIEGDVDVDPVRTALFASDASLYQIRPLAVAAPRHREDVVTLARYAAENHLPLIARGAGTGLAGESLGRGIVVDFSRHLRRVVTASDGRVRVQPGVVCERLNHYLGTLGQVFPPDPASANRTTIGSMVSIDAAGSRSLRYGTTRDYVESIEVVLASGDVVEFGREPLPPREDDLPVKRDLVGRLAQLLRQNRDLIELKQPRSRRNCSGYHLSDVVDDSALEMRRLLVGSEGTLALITEVTLRTVPVAQHTGVVLFLFERLADAARAVLEILPLEPSACDLLDRRVLSLARESDPRYAALISENAEAALVVERQGSEAIEVHGRVSLMVEQVRRKQKLAFASHEAFDPEAIALLWDLPRKVVPLLYRTKGAARPLPFIEDVAVPTEVLPEFLLRGQNLFKQHQITASLYAHAGDGQLHWRPFLNPHDAGDLRKLERLTRDLYEAVFDVGGTISGEHGDGLARTAFIAQQYGELHRVFCDVKGIFDPHNLLNPGKIVAADADFQLHNLRSQPTAESTGSSAVAPQLAWDRLEILEVAQRCNGCGTCRTQELPERMCPIFRVEPREEASPRAKANLMRHLLEGFLATGDLQSDVCKEVVDLCVNCKMCRLECPAGVDIPKLVTEIKGNYVAESGLRWGDWVISRIELFAALASLTSLGSNWLLENRAVRWGIERLFGISRQRTLPGFARRPFHRWAARRRLTGPARSASGRRVAYFVDVYTNYCDPDLGKALVRILHRHGVGVRIPAEQRGAGMPLIAAGDLEAAREVARHNLRVLAPLAREGYTILTTEPTAAVCLTQEYPDLLDDPDARFVADHVQDACQYLWQMHEQGELDGQRSAVATCVGCHTPCHLKALEIGTPGQSLLQLIPEMRVHRIEAGCSGMAGTFGLKSENFQTSLQAGWPLLSHVRESDIAWAATECSTCKMQLDQAGGKPTVHPIKLLAHSYGLMPEMADRFSGKA
jgi:FAD/FMN-containing dehydrogenase/Fe-S oxidoreductase